MARKRVIYQSEALFVAPSGSGSPTQLSRVQSVNYGFDISRTDVLQYGQAGAIDRVLLEAPIVNLDFSYYLSSGQNESALGFVLSSTKSAFSDIMTGKKDLSNYFILVSPEGTDANLETTGANSRTIGIGMGGLTSYSVEAGVGTLPTATVNAEGLNMKFYKGASGYLPEIDPTNGSGLNDVIFRIPNPNSGDGYSVLRPGDILLNVSGIGINSNDLKIQSFSINTELPRDSIQRLGNKFASFRELTYPITLNATVEAIVGDMGDTNQTLGSGNALTDLICGDAAYTLVFNLGAPSSNCDSSYTPYALKYTIKGARLDSQSFSSSIGDNKSVSLQFSAPIGGPADLNNNLFIENNVASA
jgi:hypothetical protein